MTDEKLASRRRSAHSTRSGAALRAATGTITDGTITDDLPTRRWPKRVGIAAASVAGVVSATTAAGGWYYASELLLVDTSPTEYPVEVLDVSDTTVTLTGGEADEPGLVGLEWPGGYARLGPQITRSGRQVTRELIPYPDVPAVGIRARTSFYAAPFDLAGFGKVSELHVDEVSYPGPLGSYPATYVPGDSNRWIVHVHGRGGNRAESFRLLASLHALGHPQLSIAYRNDDDAPADPDGEYGLGWTESDDLAAAIDYVRAHGADDVVLVGYSMGGAIVGNYLRTRGAAGVAGVIYDSPALSWSDILVFQSRARNLPSFAATIAGAVVRLRTGIDLAAMDQVRHADALAVPVLLFHGSADATVPVTSSDAFARARPDLITYVRPEGAGHVRSWNVDPAAYEHAAADFLRNLP
ncbi:alpha/beta hydrolase [Phytoactinopolyspora halotolerans]|uniref:Alpha/beta hydrolase n=1 Tax=Phytoactinopolyspora halotolerans TaxID=1981512 RepID=A0A6L9SGD1_9ACTN|nr:alpha/beta fold hydrolase [Phytoactinopolyspora halotolerans]NEE03150.1 alpha/beta hydrolase [Phytoactinopolyspora halotolerans]